MAHDIEQDATGAGSMAYNGRNGTPWHGLGVSMEGLQTAAEMLAAARADYEVAIRPITVAVDDHDMLAMEILKSDLQPQVKLDAINRLRVPIDKRFVTSRISPLNGTLEPFEVVKDRYHVMNNDVVLGMALDVVGASDGDAVLETVGVLDGGRQFFASIDMGSLFIDPLGVNDKIEQYLLVHTSHDGSTPIIYANTPIRAVCANTVRFAMQEAQSTFKARHTPNVDANLKRAQKVLGMSTEWAKAFTEQSEQLLRINVDAQKVDTALDRVWSKKDADTDRKLRTRETNIAAVRGLLGNDRNAGGFGMNGYSLFQAYVEYLDHYRNVDKTVRAIQSMDETHSTARRKEEFANIVLAL